jgi:hypothetical protein
MNRLHSRGTNWLLRSKRRSVILQRGEVWLFGCGMIEKIRPVLIFSIPFADTDRAVATVIFHTTAVRGSQFEIKVQVPFLTAKLFNRQQKPLNL